WTLNDGSGSNNISTVATTISISPAAKNDFDGDLQSDVLFQDVESPGRNRGGDPLAGTPQIWLVNNTTVTTQAMLDNPGTNWSVIGTGDFNGDTDADLLLYNGANGNVAVWEMNGTSIAATAGIGNIGTVWKPVGTGDFNADGNADILLFNPTNGNLAMWEMNG